MTEAPPVEALVAPASAERRHLALLMGFLTGLVLCCAYGYTLAPGITAGDAGELITAAYEFGVPHAPGYPTYTLLGWVMTHLPLGPDPAFRMNLFSMLCTIGACLVAYVLLVRRQLHPVFAGFVALGIGSGPTIWANGIVAEVYGLNLLVLMCFWLCLDQDFRDNKQRPLTWLLGGLAFTTHQTSVLALLPALWFTARRWPQTERVRRVAKTIGLMALPNLLYLQTLIAAQNPNALVWGHPDTFAEWLRFTFAPVSQQVNNAGPWHHINYLLELLFGDVWYRILGVTGHPAEMGVAIVLALAGLVAVLSAKSQADDAQKCWAISAMLYPVVFVSFTQPFGPGLAKLDPYYIPVWAMLWLLVPEGYRALLASQAQSPQRKHLGPIMKPILELMLVLGVLITGTHSATTNHHGAEADFVRKAYTEMLGAAPLNAVLLCDLDDLFVLWYLQRVENVRPDVVPVFAYFPHQVSAKDRFWTGWIYDDLAAAHPDLAVPQQSAPPQERLRAYIGQAMAVRPVLLTFLDPGYVEPMHPDFHFRDLGVGWLPQPLAWRAVSFKESQTEGQVLTVAKFYLANEAGADGYARLQAEYGESHETAYLLSRYAAGMASTAQLLTQLGNYEVALQLYQNAIAAVPARLDHYPVAVGLASSTGQISEAVRLQSLYVAQLQFRLEAGDPSDGLPELFLDESVHLADLIAQNGDLQSAQRHLAEILRLDPNNAAARALQQALLKDGPS